MSKRLNAKPPRSPLGEYLDEHDLREAAFAEKMGGLCGYRILQSSVSMWATGRRVPSRTVRPLIQLASDGVVDSAAWERYRKRKSRADSASATSTRRAG